MRSIILLLAWLATISVAAPAPFNHAYDYSDDLAKYFGSVSKYITDAKQVRSPSTSCDLSNIVLPAYASGLPAPTGLKPLYVAVGRGTQNYTCATSTSESTPVSIGAAASLYNATCIAACYVDLLEKLPSIVYTLSLPSDPSDPLPPANLDLLGHHFFLGSTPIFDLDTTAEQQYGIAYTKKADQLNAPSDAVEGPDGAVAWLYLTTINGTIGGYQSVYRVQTVAGSAPATCEGLPSLVTVQYAAIYYFFGK